VGVKWFRMIVEKFVHLSNSASRILESRWLPANWFDMVDAEDEAAAADAFHCTEGFANGLLDFPAYQPCPPESTG
jgi:hypothetical protein